MTSLIITISLLIVFLIIFYFNYPSGRIGNMVDGYINANSYRLMVVSKSTETQYAPHFNLINTIRDTETLEEIREIFLRAKVYDVYALRCPIPYDISYTPTIFNIEAYGRFIRWRYSALLTLCSYTGESSLSFTAERNFPWRGARKIFLHLHINEPDTEKLLSLIEQHSW